MSFFKTDDGHLHRGRLVGLLYTVGLLPSCSFDYDSKCIVWLAFTGGWWLSFSDKRQAQSVTDLIGNARRLCGVLLIILAAAGWLYLTVRS